MDNEQKTEEMKELELEIKDYKALEILNNSEGGQMLRDGLVKVITSEIDFLLTNYSEIPETLLRAKLAKISANANIARVLTRAKTNKELCEEHLKSLIN